MYVTFPKTLGITLLESVLGRGRYETPYMLVSNPSHATEKLWNRTGYMGILFERRV